MGMRSKTVSLGWIQIQKLMRRRSKTNTKKLKAFARRLYPSITGLVEVEQAAQVVVTKMRKKRTMNCKAFIVECSFFVGFRWPYVSVVNMCAVRLHRLA